MLNLITLLIYACVAVAAALAGTLLLAAMHLYVFRKQPPDFEDDERGMDLSDPLARQRLQQVIEKYGIEGDADIRSGIVLPPVPLEQAQPLAIVLDNAAGMISRLRNPAASSLYVRDSINDRFMLLVDLDLDHLREAAQIMREIARGR